MTADQIVVALKNHRGEVCVAACFGHDTPYIRVYKSDLIAHFKALANQETGCGIDKSHDGATLYVDHAFK